MAQHSYRGKEHLAALIEQMLLSLRPQICEESRLMELTLQQFRTLIMLYTSGSPAYEQHLLSART